MGAKANALKELEAVMSEYDLAPSTVGREISGDPSFMERMRDPEKSITSNTLDKVFKYVLKIRGQLDLDLDLEKDLDK